jgi:glycine/D-amino acid oxidase-like deaminating enzyme
VLPASRQPGLHRLRQAGAGGCRQLHRVGRDGRHETADRKPCAAGLRFRGAEAFIDNVVTFGAGHFYVSQSDKGGLVFGGDIDGYNSYAQRGNLATVEHVAEEGVAMIPALSRVRVLRSWGGVMDMSMDGSPIIDRTHIDNLYLNAAGVTAASRPRPPPASATPI